MTSEEQIRIALTAIQYVLSRTQTDPDLGYYLGRGSEAFRLLCVAEAALTGEGHPREVEDRRARDLQPEYRRRRPRVILLEERVQELEDRLAGEAP